MSTTSIMLIIGMIIFILYIQAIGIEKLIAEIMSVNIFILTIAILIDILCIGLFTISWYIFLRNPGVKFRECFEIVLVSIFGDLMIPTASISGEFLRVSLTAKRGGISISEALMSVILHRIVLALTFGLILLISSISLLSQNIMGSYTFLVIATIDIFIIVVLICAVKKFYKLRSFIEKSILKVGEILKKFKSDYNIESLKSRILISLERIEMCLTNFKFNTFALSFIILTLRWFLIAMIPYVMFISLNYEVSYWMVLSVSALMSMIQMIPVIIPGMIGIMEISTTALFVGFGIPLSIAASVTILMRIVTFWFELFLGAIAVSVQGIKGLSNSMQS